MRYVGTALLAAVFFLSGCASTPTTPVDLSDADFRASMAQADAVAAKGDTELAVATYRKVASDNPNRDDPWVKIGQIRFAKGEYALAIVAAEEALKRNPANRMAKSIHAVGGLRLAMRSLEALRKDDDLTGDAAADAQQLATMLREVLGQRNLIVDPPKSPPPARPTARRSARVQPAAGHVVQAPARPAPPAQSAGGNPLDAFK